MTKSTTKMARKKLVSSNSLENIIHYGVKTIPLVIGFGIPLAYLSLKTLRAEYGEAEYHIAGVVMGSLGRIMDKYSTHLFLKSWNKYKVSHPKECSNYKELNRLVGNKLEFKDFYSKMPFSDIVSTNLSVFFPPFGAAYMIMGPYISYNNLKLKKNLEERCTEKLKPIVKRTLKQKDL